MVNKKAKNIKDITIQETNDNSILSKASIVTSGYFHDPYLPLFTTRVPRRAPLVHRGYYCRAKAIDHSLRTFIQHHHDSDTRFQIVSLGAGFDTSYFRLKELGLLEKCRFIEIDFEDVMRRKIAIIKQHQVLSHTIGQFEIGTTYHSLKSGDYVIIPCDLTNLKALEGYLEKFLVDFDIPTLFFSECVLTYVDFQHSVKLLEWIQNKFKRTAVVIYEQIRPDDAFGRIMMRHFDKVQSPLRRIRELSDMEKHKTLLRKLSYQDVLAFDLNYFYTYYLDEEEKERIVQLEYFDEYEEWNLKCAHYIITAAFSGIYCMFLNL